MRPPLRVRRAFSLVEALVALALIALIAAIMIPTAKSQLDKSEVAAVASNLQAIREAVLAFRENVGFYPSTLEQLASKPGTGTVPTLNSCGASLATGIPNWRGPYLAQAIESAGLQSGDVLIRNALVRTPSTSSSGTPEGTLAVEVDDAVLDANHTFITDVEKLFDPVSSQTLGAIQWVVVSAPVYRMSFHIGIRGC